MFWHCLGALFSPSFGYDLAVFSSLGGLFFLLALAGGYTSVPLVSLSLPLPFATSGPHSGEWLFIHKPQTLTECNGFETEFKCFWYEQLMLSARRSRMLESWWN